MHRSRATWLVAAAVALSCVPLAATWSLQLADRESVRESDSAPVTAAEWRFRHGSHLAPDWTTTERKAQYEKHCARCHVFVEKQGPEPRDGDPLGFVPVAQACAGCHYSGVGIDQHDPARLEFTGGEPPPPNRESTYDHSLPGHRARACVECHVPGRGSLGDFRYPDVKFTTPATMAVCATCHHHGADDPAKAAQDDVHKDRVTGAWSATWTEAVSCGDCHKAGTPRMLDRHQRAKERLFEHASHVPRTDLGETSLGQSCKGCHTMDAKAAAATMGVTQVSCGKCHFGDQGAITTQLAEDRAFDRMPTLVSHAAKGHQQKCSVCHPMANDATDPSVGRLYVNCTATCHGERKVPRHGQWSCTNCHANDNAKTEAEASAIKTVEVSRPAAPSTFAFTAAAHPGITHDAPIVHPVTNGRACADCHRRELDGLVRPAAARPFSHDGHLQQVSAAAPATACTTCHQNVRETAKADQVHAFDAASARERSSCTAVCHQAPQMHVAATSHEITVPLFSHAQHASHACAECHVTANGVTNLRAATLTDNGGAFSCARCHGHKDPAKVERTGSYRTDPQSNVCFQCHVEKAGGDSFAPEPRREQRFQLVAGVRQFHSKGGECRKCHAYDDPQKPPRTTPIVGSEHRSLHKSMDIAVGGVTRNLPGANTDGIDCMRCHAWDPRRR